MRIKRKVPVNKASVNNEVVKYVDYVEKDLSNKVTRLQSSLTTLAQQFNDLRVKQDAINADFEARITALESAPVD